MGCMFFGPGHLFFDLYMFFGSGRIFFGPGGTKNVGPGGTKNVEDVPVFSGPCGDIFFGPACICAGPRDFFLDSQINCF